MVVVESGMSVAKVRRLKILSPEEESQAENLQNRFLFLARVRTMGYQWEALEKDLVPSNRLYAAILNETINIAESSTHKRKLTC